MQIITAGTLKGGTGKTATVFNLAGLLAENEPVLLIDCDPQTNLSLNCGVDITDARIKTVTEIFESGADAEELIFRRPVKELPNLDIIPSGILLAAAELKLMSVTGRESILKYYLQDNAAVFADYKYVMIDTSPSMSVINQNAFFAADAIILVSDISLNGIQGAELFIELWKTARRGLRKEDNVRALILNNFDRRIKLSSEMTEYASENESTKDILINTVIPASVQVKNCEIEHLPINLLHKNTPVHKAYESVAAELKERGIL